MNSAPASKLRVVFDTNIYVSAFTHQGRPFQIWQQAVERRFVLLVSPDIMRELAGDAPGEIGLAGACNPIPAQTLGQSGRHYQPHPTLAVIEADPSDDRILECAVSGRADLIVSGDRHLRSLKSFRAIGIVSAVDLHRTLGL